MAGAVAVTCESCHHWRPLESVPYLGECASPSSRSYKKPTFSDKPAEECYVKLSPDSVEFLWCQTHRQTIFSLELPEHRGCRLFVATASLPVEDMMELTLAGD